MLEGSEFVGLSDLLDQDTTSYEYFYSLPKRIQQKVRQMDVGSFEAMTDYVSQIREKEEV